MKIGQEIEDALRREFSPHALTITDESEKHRGHSGWREGGETHFRVEIVSARFAGRSRLECHQLIYRALTPSPFDRIHALSISAAAK